MPTNNNVIDALQEALILVDKMAALLRVAGCDSVDKFDKEALRLKVILREAMTSGWEDRA